MRTFLAVVAAAVAAVPLAVSQTDGPQPLPFPGTLAGEERVGPSGGRSLAETVVRQVRPARGVLEEKEALGVVVGVYGEKGRTGRYTWVVEPAVSAESGSRKPDQGRAVAASPRPRIARELARVLARAKEDEAVPVIVLLDEELRTPLSQSDYAAYASFDAPAPDGAERQARVAARQQEAQRLQEGVQSWLAAYGVKSSGFWLMNGLSARVPASLVPILAAHPEVRALALDSQLTLTGATVWDGANAKASSGLNAGRFVSNGFSGERENPATGLNLSVAVLDFVFNVGHPVFRDSSTGPSRIRSTWTCNGGNPCRTGLPAVPPGDTAPHGTLCAGAAAGDAMDQQISGTTSQRRDRTGLAEEAEMMFISTGAISDTSRGLQRAVASNADVVSESFGGVDAVCDGTYGGWEEAVYNAHQAGVIVVGSAGNGRDPNRTGNCHLTGLAEVPSQFVVSGTLDPGTGAYATVGNTNPDGTSIWSRGGVNVVIDGFSFPEAFSGVSVSVPATWGFGAAAGSGFVPTGGTSLSAPQVAGAAVLFKDWMIGQGFGAFANSPGVIFANMLAMSDRAETATTYRTSGFNPLWGGGRFQMRYYLQDEHPSGLWRWETAKYTVGHGQRIQHQVGGAGPEPAGIRLFKTYAVFFEKNGSNVADIDLWVFDRCGADRTFLGADRSRDSKSMVALDSVAAGKDLCIELEGFHVPPGQTREVVLVNYYTDETAMR